MEKYDLIEAGCRFWFNDNDKVRSPFPDQIQAEAKEAAQAEYLKWVHNLTGQDRKEVTDDELVSVFETFLFGEGIRLVGPKDPEAILTLQHPFMPRPGDIVEDEARGSSQVVRREVEQKDDERVYLIVHLETLDAKTPWQTEFLLPA